jgi:uncharacterized protein (TIGR00251 family)
VSLPPFIRETDDGFLLRVRVQPRASRNEITGRTGDELKIRVTAPPVDSAANEAVVKLLAKTLNVPKSAVALVKGSSSRSKTLKIERAAPEEAARLLNA